MIAAVFSTGGAMVGTLGGVGGAVISFAAIGTRGYRWARLLIGAVLACLLTLPLAGAALGAPGDLDPAFGSGGKTTIDFGGADDAYASALQSDGKLVLVGSTSAGASPHDFAIARLSTNGTLDPTFGSGGKTTIDFGDDDIAQSVAIQPDGKILVAGETGPAGSTRGVIARLNADGTLDSSFGTAGEVVFNSSLSNCTAVLVRPDGRIVLVGDIVSQATQTDFGAVQLTAAGAVDAPFGNGAGAQSIDFGGNDDHATSAALQPNGAIVIGGYTLVGASHRFAAARLTAAGAVDPTFGGGTGQTTIDLGGDNGAHALALQPDGKIVLAGETLAGSGGGDGAVVRLNADGTPDQSFGASGVVLIDFGGQDFGNAVAVAPDGSIVFAGETIQGIAADFAVARLTSAGANDLTFGSAGKLTTDFGGQDIARSVDIQTDGKIVVAGSGGNSDFAVERLLGSSATGTGTGPGPGTGTGTGGTGTGTGTGGTGTGTSAPKNPINCRTGLVPVQSHGRWRCATVPSADDDQLLPSAADLPGVKAAGSGAADAVTALGVRAPSGLTRPVADGKSFVDRGHRLAIGVFTLKTAGRASAALAGLAHGRRKVALVRGVTGWERARITKRSTDVAIAFRVNRAVGSVRLRARGRLAKAAVTTMAYAQALALRLQRVLNLSAWQRVTDQIRPDGSFTPRTALQAFAVAYGPLPGVKRPSGAAGPGIDGTSAIQMVQQVWTRLSAVQKAAINREIDIDVPGPNARSAAANDEPSLTADPQLTALAAQYVAVYAAKIPAPPAVTVRVFDSQEPLGSSLADAYDEGSYCRVRWAPATFQRPAQYQHEILAHEVFHCYQFVLDPGHGAEPQWVSDGTADWAAEFVTGFEDGWLAQYLATPTIPLASRTYDALGFFGHADEVGGRGSLFTKIRAVLAAHDVAPTFSAAGGASPDFTQTWGSSVWHTPVAGSAWSQSDPVFASVTAVPAIPVEDSTTLTSSPYSVGEYGLVPNGDRPLVDIASNGDARVGTPSADLGVVTGDSWYCFSSCECPPDQEPVDLPPSTKISTNVLRVAMSAGDDFGLATVTYHSMDEFCRDPNTPGSGGGGGSAKGPPGLQIRSLDDNSSLLGTISQGVCQFGGGNFTATGSGGGYRFSMRIAGATDPGEFEIPNNNTSTYVKVAAGGGGVFSTIGRNTTVLGTTGPRVAGEAIVRTRIVKVGKRTTTRYQLGVIIDDLVKGGKPGVSMIPGPGGLKC
jgi:uncharacterized delta-60 repeat protein